MVYNGIVAQFGRCEYNLLSIELDTQDTILALLNWFISTLQQNATPGAEAVTAAVQSTLSVLNQSLGKGSAELSQGQSTGQRPSMDQEMARSKI